MDQEQIAPEQLGPSPNFPQHLWGEPASNFDVSTVKPHTCMVNIRQIGNHIHCYDGHHGMTIPPGKMLVQKDGKFDLVDIVVHDSFDLSTNDKRDTVADKQPPPAEGSRPTAGSKATKLK